MGDSILWLSSSTRSVSSEVKGIGLAAPTLASRTGFGRWVLGCRVTVRWPCVLKQNSPIEAVRSAMMVFIGGPLRMIFQPPASPHLGLRRLLLPPHGALHVG